MAPRPDRYTLDEAARIVGLPVPRLRRWAREGFIRPSLPGPGRGACYSFQDLVGLRTAKSLLDHGIPLRRVRRSIGSLRQHLPEFQGDLSRLRIFADGQRLVVGHRTFLLDPLTGQLLLDFRGRRDGPQVQGLGRSRELAEEWFRRGLAADGDPARQGRALEAYQRAVELDPGHADAHINLGTLHYDLGQMAEARTHYERAIEADPRNALAHYNLGNVLDEEGDLEGAIAVFRRALALAPGYANAHYNLAIVYEKRGQQSQARRHWRAYLTLDPDSPWSRYARERLTRPERGQPERR